MLGLLQLGLWRDRRTELEESVWRKAIERRKRECFDFRWLESECGRQSNMWKGMHGQPKAHHPGLLSDRVHEERRRKEEDVLLFTPLSARDHQREDQRYCLRNNVYEYLWWQSPHDLFLFIKAKRTSWLGFYTATVLYILLQAPAWVVWELKCLIS